MTDNTTLTNTQIPCISVIIPIFNMEKYLVQALDSVLCQTLRNIEIICIDDGSTDSTPQILAEYAARDPRIRVITQENKGVGAARNFGIRAARGEFIAFLDPDDFLPDELTYEVIYLWAKEMQVKVCGGSIYTFNVTENKIRPREKVGYIADQAFYKEGLRCFSDWQFDYGFYRYIFDRKMLVENEIFFPSYERFQDPPFCARALEFAGLFYAVQRPTYIYRRGHNSPNFGDPKRVRDLLRGIRDQLKFSRERNYAKLHWLQIHRLFEEFKPKIIEVLNTFPELLVSHGTEPLPDAAPQLAKDLFEVLREISGLVDIHLAQKYDKDVLPYSVYGDIFEQKIKVSIIIPVYNVERYLRECLDSVVNQTLKEIEIICVNDGSRDASLSILEEYERKDSRVKVISKPNSGYGHTMNVGLANAEGEYVGIVESDDYVAPEMYEELFKKAKELHLDIIKGGFCRFYGEKENGRNFECSPITSPKNCNRVFDMRRTLEPFDFSMHTWAGIYRKAYLNENGIGWNETPGAAYQDNGFWFLTFAYAARVYFVNKNYYMLRRDNPNSSFYRRDQVFAMNGEYRYIREKLEGNLLLWNRVSGKWCKWKYTNYLFTFNRIGSEFEREFAYTISKEFAEHDREGILQKGDFSAFRRGVISLLITNPEEWLKRQIEIKHDLIKSREDWLSKSRGEVDSLAQQEEGKHEVVESEDLARPHRRIYPAFLVRLGAMFIFNKSARKRWRAEHLDLKPKDGIDINRLPPREVAILRERRRSKSVFWRVFDAVVPATRGKMAHIERHLRENSELQTRNLCRTFGEQMQHFIAEIRKSRDEINKKLDEAKRQIMHDHSTRIGWVRERLTLRVLAASQKQEALMSNVRTEISQEMDAIRQDVAVLKQFVAQSETDSKEHTENILLPKLAEVAQNLQIVSSAVATLEQSAEQASKDGGTVKGLLDDIIHATAFMKSALSELEWGQVFNNAIANSDWLTNKSFFPGRWAVGYPFLYVLYRVLTDGKPRRILELGLGQTTRMISQYAAGNPKIVHTVVEHDLLWKENFSKSFDLPKSTEVKMLELAKVAYGDAPEVVVYKDFAKTFSGKKFDFICIDGPFGGMAKKYARVDILPLLPECLNASFVIMLDDYNRAGEKATVAEIRRILKEANIEFFEKIYYGEKQFWIATSPDLKFLCSC